MDILILIAGLVLVTLGANFLTDGASGIAARLGIPDFIIGLTVVAIGTSMPELVVSLFSAMRGEGDMAIGNVVGSNIFNGFLILGMVAIIRPVLLTRNNLLKDLPFLLLASVLMLIMTADVYLDGALFGVITRSEGITLLGFFFIFIAYTIFSAEDSATGNTISERRKRIIARQKNIWIRILMLAGGIVGLVFGAELFLDGATSIAENLGVSKAVIAATLVAAGTSLPELATSVVAAIKGNTGIAFGNIVGSNIANIFLVLGASAAVNPLTMGDILIGDIFAVVAVPVVIFIPVLLFRRRKIGYPEGIVSLLLYGAYTMWILMR